MKKCDQTYQNQTSWQIGSLSASPNRTTESIWGLIVHTMHVVCLAYYYYPLKYLKKIKNGLFLYLEIACVHTYAWYAVRWHTKPFHHFNFWVRPTLSVSVCACTSSLLGLQLPQASCTWLSVLETRHYSQSKGARLPRRASSCYFGKAALVLGHRGWF